VYPFYFKFICWGYFNGSLAKFGTQLPTSFYLSPLFDTQAGELAGSFKTRREHQLIEDDHTTFIFNRRASVTSEQEYKGHHGKLESYLLIQHWHKEIFSIFNEI
jgi:hypothetical protein